MAERKREKGEGRCETVPQPFLTSFSVFPAPVRSWTRKWQSILFQKLNRGAEEWRLQMLTAPLFSMRKPLGNNH